ncbi:hypothetical protein V6N12_049397 [Hibiscus sabdariffa]|uniref:DC1 domain-containing protein n=1 Tax=Hibiscus sabdariffa TaxID=183260 RepID=A0ABR2CB78_9ROSI
MVATEIKHGYHDHNLRLTLSGDIEDDGQCDGCMRPISTPFYTCDRCKFSLHKDCAELPREKRHPFHKHVLTLTNSSLSPVNGYSICYGCDRPYNGFSYRCYNEDCKQHFNWDIRCLSNTDGATSKTCFGFFISTLHCVIIIAYALPCLFRPDIICNKSSISAIHKDGSKVKHILPWITPSLRLRVGERWRDGNSSFQPKHPLVFVIVER